MSQRRGAGSLAGLQEGDRPGVAAQHLTGRVGSLTDLGAPVAVVGRKVDLAEDFIDDAVEDLALVGDVVVDRHRFDAEFCGERADRQRSYARRIPGTARSPSGELELIA